MSPTARLEKQKQSGGAGFEGAMRLGSSQASCRNRWSDSNRFFTPVAGDVEVQPPGEQPTDPATLFSAAAPDFWRQG